MTRHTFARAQTQGQTFAHFVRQDICQHRAGARVFLRNSIGPIREGSRILFRHEKCRDCGARLQSIES